MKNCKMLYKDSSRF